MPSNYYPRGKRPSARGKRRARRQSVPAPVLALCAVMVVAILIAVTVKLAGGGDARQALVTLAEPTATPDAQVSTSLETPAPAETPAGQPTDSPLEAATPPAAITTSPANAPASGRSVRIRSVGDVIMHEPLLQSAYDKASDTYDFADYFSAISGVLSDADWTAINIEATLAKGKYGYSGYPQFSTPHSILKNLRACGVDMLTMCNNHMLDGYFDGLKLSLDYADQAGLAHIGAFRTQAERDKPQIIEIGGIKVGFLNYTQGTNGLEEIADPDALVYGFTYIKNANFAYDVAALKGAGAEVVVAYMHWGEEYVREPDEAMRKVARNLVAAGADVIVGGHPHVVQPAEYVTTTDSLGATRTGLVLYSMGNFISDQRTQYRDSGVIFEFTLQENASGKIDVVSPAYIPTYVWRWGDEASGYEYRVLAIGQWLNERPTGMDDESYSRMLQCWDEIRVQMNYDAICLAKPE